MVVAKNNLYDRRPFRARVPCRHRFSVFPNRPAGVKILLHQITISSEYPQYIHACRFAIFNDNSCSLYQRDERLFDFRQTPLLLRRYPSGLITSYLTFSASYVTPRVDSTSAARPTPWQRLASVPCVGKMLCVFRTPTRSLVCSPHVLRKVLFDPTRGEPPRVQSAYSSMTTKAVLASCDLIPATSNHAQDVSLRSESFTILWVAPPPRSLK